MWLIGFTVVFILLLVGLVTTIVMSNRISPELFCVLIIWLSRTAQTLFYGTVLGLLWVLGYTTFGGTVT